MKNCELNELGAEGCKKETVEVGSKKDQMVKSNLFFSYDISAQDLEKLGMSIGTSTSSSENFNVETDTCYHYTKCGKSIFEI